MGQGRDQKVRVTCHPKMVISYFHEIVVKSDFELQSYGPDTILLQGHAVTLTFKVLTKLCLPNVI